MSTHTPPKSAARTERNHRYLVSLWESAPNQAADAPEDLQGVVWEADARDPGRITTPAKFSGLAALPEVLSTLLARKSKGGEVE